MYGTAACLPKDGQPQQQRHLMEQQCDVRKRTTTGVHRPRGGNCSEHDGTTIPDDVDQAAKQREMPIPKQKFIPYRHIVILFCLLLILLSAGFRFLTKLQFIRCITLVPTFLCAYSGFQHRSNPLQGLIPLTLVATVLCAQLPAAVATAFAVTGVIVFSWSTVASPFDSTTTTTNHESGGSSLVGFVTTAVAIVSMIAVLLTENFLIWVVSATFEAGQSSATEPPPLQDNGQRIMKSLIFNGLEKVQVVGLRRMWNTQWSLVACMAVALFVVQVGFGGTSSSSGVRRHRTLFGVATRGVTTVAIARTIRTVSFVLTVLPSQVKNCYAQRFPPIVTLQNDTMAWIMVGLQPRSHGGCNDLIISGHAVITSTLACVATSVANNKLFSVALWTMVFLDYSVEIYEGFHYSVDMWLGMVLVVLLWRVLEPMEGFEDEKTASGGTGATKLSSTTLKPSDAIVYVPPALVTYIQLNVLPEATANIVIVCFVLTAVMIYIVFVRGQKDEQKKRFLMHYIQHMAICLLVLALGVYL